MNRETEAIRNLLAWLLQEPNPNFLEPSGDSNQTTGLEKFGPDSPQLNDIDPLDSEEVSLTQVHLNGSNHFFLGESQLFQSGDKLAVEDRFYALIKRRLSAEIEHKPPLFPWETDVYEYTDSVTADGVPSHFWSTQLQNLNLPVPMPEVILAHLLEHCQELVQTSLREGAKLVQAVEALFPGQAPALNQLAGMVLASPSRSGTLTPQRTSQQLGFPSNYDAATPAQQMALSLIAAREIIDSLTLTVSPSHPQVERLWQTTAGLVRFSVQYQVETGHLRIQGHLPCAGSFQIRGANAEAAAQRQTSGALSVELFDLVPDQIYSLNIRLDGMEHTPLVFAIHPMTNAE